MRALQTHPAGSTNMTGAEELALLHKLTAFEACAGIEQLRTTREPIWFTLEEAQFVTDAVKLAWSMRKICGIEPKR